MGCREKYKNRTFKELVVKLTSDFENKANNVSNSFYQLSILPLIATTFKKLHRILYIYNDVFLKAMKEKLNLTIPSACNQSWNTMSVSTDGRYCDSCQKEVIDFRRFSQMEIQEWFRQHHNEKTCGRFHLGQLSAPESVKHAKWTSIIIKTKVFFISLLAFSADLKATPATHQKKSLMESVPVKVHKEFRSQVTERRMTGDSTRIIQGIVVDEAQPMIGVAIKVKGTNIHVFTDQNGQFKIDLSDLADDNKPILMVSYIGYDHLEQAVNLNSDKPIRINMSQAASLLGEICVKRPNLFKRFINLFK